MSDHERDLAAGAALGGLTPDEAASLEEEASRNPALAAQLEEYRETVSMLEAGVARDELPADFIEGVLARIESEGTEPEAEAVPAPERPPRRRSRRLWPVLAAGAAAAAATTAIVIVATSDSLGQPDARAVVQGTADFPLVEGEARLFGSERSDGKLVLDLAEVPVPRTGEHYEVWVLRSDAEEMEAVGVFTPVDSSVDLEFRLPGPGDYAAVDVSVEPDGGPAEHSGASLAGGRFEQGPS